MSTNEGQKVLTLFDVAWSVLTGMTHHAVDVTRPVFQNVVPEGEEISELNVLLLIFKEIKD